MEEESHFVSHFKGAKKGQTYSVTACDNNAIEFNGGPPNGNLIGIILVVLKSTVNRWRIMSCLITANWLRNQDLLTNGF